MDPGRLLRAIEVFRAKIDTSIRGGSDPCSKQVLEASRRLDRLVETYHRTKVPLYKQRAADSPG